jgi:hypothetical protein
MSHRALGNIPKVEGGKRPIDSNGNPQYPEKVSELCKERISCSEL